VGLFKSMKDLAGITRGARELHEQHLAQQGYQPGMRGMMSQMGDMLGDASEQLKDLKDQTGDKSRLLAEGIPGEGVIVAMGTPARGAQIFSLDVDLEVHLPGREAYRVANQYMVPATATINEGIRLPVRVDPADPSRLAIDWDRAAQEPARGQVRPVAEAPVSAVSAVAGSGGDTVDQLERLARLRDSGALTDAEFALQKARILSG